MPTCTYAIKRTVRNKTFGNAYFHLMLQWLLRFYANNF